MKNFGEQQEDLSQEPRSVFLGKRSFKVIAVNPTEEWMKERKIYVKDGEISGRTSSVPQKKDDPSSPKVRASRIDVIIQDAFCDDSEGILKTSFYLQERYNTSNDGKKCQIINRYGGTLWVPVEEAKSLNISNPMIGTSPYVLDGIKPAIVGEESLVKFIRAIRNLNNVKHDTKEEDKLKLPSMFEKTDLDKLFKGDFRDITNLITAGEPIVGYLLGARMSDKGSHYQDIYREIPMRPYMMKATDNSYLCKQVLSDQANGRYASTFFDLEDLSYREYSNNGPKATKDEDLLGSSAFSANDGFGEDDPFASANSSFSVGSEEDDDDLFG